MIKIKETDVYGWEAAIRGMRNPMNSWDKSDSYWTHIEDSETLETANYQYFVGENDLKLMKFLSKAGSDHAKFLRMINVTVDVTAPIYWWKEFKTYRVGRKFADEEPDLIPDDYLEYDIEMNSCSTMHKIHEKEFTEEDFSIEHLSIESLMDVWDSDGIIDTRSPASMMFDVITMLNLCREKYLETKDKTWWWQMIQLLPSSYNQKRTIQLNYQVLKNMYFARKNHKLDEWRTFCDWIKSLPYAELIVGDAVGE